MNYVIKLTIPKTVYSTVLSKCIFKGKGSKNFGRCDLGSLLCSCYVA
jgi:hypothetical protein